MRSSHWKSLLLLFLPVFAFSACTGQSTIVSPTTAPTITRPATVQPQVVEDPLVWMDPAIPEELAASLLSATGTTITDNRSSADLVFSMRNQGENAGTLVGSVTWVYALEAPFPTVTDEVSLETLKGFWRGEEFEALPFDTILVSRETLAVFEALWGVASTEKVVTVDESQFTTNDFSQRRTWAIVPFDQIAPRWKVIAVDGISPLDKPMDAADYGLTVSFDLSTVDSNETLVETGKMLLAELPATNRDESKMTVLMMTGTTALTRAIAYKMELKGVDYPIEKVMDWFADADLIHVSNEVSFNPDCPYPNPYQSGLRFCSDPKYIQVLQDLGVDIVELTGNHENDYGPEYFVSSIEMYEANGWYYYGGGRTQSEAQAPITMESNGNKIAFIGCDPNGPTSDWATETSAGAAQCDMEYYNQQISSLKAQGYVVIATFQHQEVYTYLYGDLIADDFRNAAAAGADIVSGSQSHYAMGFQFEGNSLIHYGLGNFLFDQMWSDEGNVGENIRRQFIDRHIIYNGKYINTQLYTAWLVDWAQPTPMDEEQRISFLTDIFSNSMWSERNENN